MLLVLWLCLVSATISNIVKENNQASVLFKERGLLEISGKNYYVLMDISIDGLIKSIDPISEAIEQISVDLAAELNMLNSRKKAKKAQHTQPDHAPHVGYEELSETLSHSLQEHLTFLTADLKQRL